MPEITLNPNQERSVKTSGLFLSIINSDGQFYISAEQFGRVVGKVGRQYELPEVTEVTFENPGADPLVIEYETANIKIHGSGSGTVSIENKPIIQRIEEGLQVSATVSGIDDGKIRAIQANVLTPLPKLTIAPKTAAKLVDANDVTNRRVSLQVASTQLTALYVGKDNTIDNTKGVIVAGSMDAIGSAVIENTSEIWLFNDSADTDAIVLAAEEYRP